MLAPSKHGANQLVKTFLDRLFTLCNMGILCGESGRTPESYDLRVAVAMYYRGRRVLIRTGEHFETGIIVFGHGLPEIVTCM